MEDVVDDASHWPVWKIVLVAVMVVFGCLGIVLGTFFQDDGWDTYITDTLWHDKTDVAHEQAELAAGSVALPHSFVMPLAQRHPPSLQDWARAAVLARTHSEAHTLLWSVDKLLASGSGVIVDATWTNWVSDVRSSAPTAQYNCGSDKDAVGADVDWTVLAKDLTRRVSSAHTNTSNVAGAVELLRCSPGSVVAGFSRVKSPLDKHLSVPMVVSLLSNHSEWGQLSSSVEPLIPGDISLEEDIMCDSRRTNDVARRVHLCQRGPEDTSEYPCTVVNLDSFVDAPNLRVLLVNQHHPFLGNPKVLALPRGAGIPRARLSQAIHNISRLVQTSDSMLQRDRLLSVIGVVGPDKRVDVGLPAEWLTSAVAPINRSLGGTLYGIAAPWRQQGQVPSLTRYTQDLTRTKFLLSPAGAIAAAGDTLSGADTRYHWECLLLGCVPVLQRGFGLERTFHGLPVAWVDSWLSVTAPWLEQAWVEVMLLRHQWQYRRILRSFWIASIARLATGQAEVDELFPLYHHEIDRDRRGSYLTCLPAEQPTAWQCDWQFPNGSHSVCGRSLATSNGGTTAGGSSAGGSSEISSSASPSDESGGSSSSGGSSELSPIASTSDGSSGSSSAGGSEASSSSSSSSSSSGGSNGLSASGGSSGGLPSHSGSESASSSEAPEQPANYGTGPMPKFKLVSSTKPNQLYLEESLSRPFNESRWRMALQMAVEGTGQAELLRRAAAAIVKEDNVLGPRGVQKWREVKPHLKMSCFARDDHAMNYSQLVKYEATQRAEYLQSHPNDTEFQHLPVPIAELAFCHAGNLMQTDGMFDKVKGPVILLPIFDENWGFFSTYFPNRTVEWSTLDEWLKCDILERPWDRAHVCPPKEPPRTAPGTPPRVPPIPHPCGVDDLYAYLDDPRILAVFAGQHHNLSHPKIFTLPLGTSAPKGTMYRALQKVAKQVQGKERFLLVNLNAGSLAWRQQILATLNATFKGTLRNEFQLKHKLEFEEFARHVASSYFVFSPSGMGADCYRHWESLYFGSVPLVESGMGLERMFTKLPVLFVDDWSAVDAAMLEQAWVEVLYNLDRWEYQRLDKRYWLDTVQNLSRTGDFDTLLQQFPQTSRAGRVIRPGPSPAHAHSMNCVEEGQDFVCRFGPGNECGRAKKGG